MQTQRKSTIRNALALAWGTHLATLRQYLPDVLTGKDAEDLHQFRVALRKTRALLTLFQKVIPPASRFKDDFKWLAGATGEVRDIDVLIAHARHWTATATAEESRSAPIIAQLHKDRAAAHAKLGAALRGDRARNLLENWWQFLSTLAEVDLPPVADVRARTAVEVSVIKHSRRLLQDGRAVVLAPDAVLLHELRIRGKRLRYLLESFDVLLKKRDIEPLGKALRKLQDVLGAHQDAVVAAAHWRKLANMRGYRTAANTGALALLNEWTTAAEMQQQESRLGLAKALRKFARACRHL